LAAKHKREFGISLLFECTFVAQFAPQIEKLRGSNRDVIYFFLSESNLFHPIKFGVGLYNSRHDGCFSSQRSRNLTRHMITSKG
jgi:hypothetical protein